EPGLIQRLPGELLDAVSGALANPLIGIALRADAESDDGEIGRQDAVEIEVIDRRQELPPRQVPGGAEDDEHARLRQERLGSAGGERIFFRCRSWHFVASISLVIDRWSLIVGH